MQDDPTSKKRDAAAGFPKPRTIWFLALVFVVVGIGILAVAPARLLQNWLPGASVTEQGKLIGTAAQIVLVGLGGIVAIVGVALSLSRHRQEIQAAARDRNKERFETEREYRSRFVSAVELLSADEPIKRSAALYALAALGDDWLHHGRPDETQVCVDVICAYLRGPLPEGVERTPDDEVEVRTTGYNIVGSHLRAEGGWGALKLDLSRSLIDFPVHLSSLYLHGRGTLSLSGARVVGDGRLRVARWEIHDAATLDLAGTQIGERCVVALRNGLVRDQGTLKMRWARVYETGRLGFRQTVIRDRGVLDLDSTRVHDRGAVDIRRVFISENGSLQLRRTEVLARGRLTVQYLQARNDSRILLNLARVREDGMASITETDLDATSLLDLYQARITDQALVRLEGAALYAEGTSLEGAKIADDGPIRLLNGERLTPAPFQFEADDPDVAPEEAVN